MRDKTEDCLVEFTQKLRFNDLDERTLEAAHLRIIDSIGVALAALHAPPVQALVRMALAMQTVNGARIWGSGEKTTPEHAALANGTMVRYLDMSDAYTLTSTAHPSDNKAGLIALAEYLNRPFADLVLAIIVSYEVQCRFCDVAPFHQQGWDQPVVGAPAAALGAARLLGLDADQTRHALSLAVTPNLPTYQTRKGELSMWKNLAGPNGCRTGVHAAMMAAAGISGPACSFEGPHGLWKQTLNKTLDVPIPTDFRNHVFAVEQSDIKLYPVRNACQLPVQLSLELREQIDFRKIETITIWTDEHSFGLPSKDPALWQPATRETADHSLPFCVAAALIDGKIDLETFSKKRFLDQDILSLITQTTIKFDADFSAAAPAQRSCRLQARDKQGNIHELEGIWLPGDTARLPDKNQVASKFLQLGLTNLPESRVRTIYDSLASIQYPDGCTTLVDHLVMPD